MKNTAVREQQKNDLTKPVDREHKTQTIDLEIPVVGSDWKPFVGFFIIFNILILQGALSYGYVATPSTLVTQISHLLSFTLGIGALVAFEQRNFIETINSIKLKRIEGRLLLYIGLFLQAILGIVDFTTGALSTWSIIESFGCIVGLYLIISWTFLAFLRDLYLGCTFIPDVYPETVTLVSEIGSKAVNPHEVKIGDIIQVNAGERILFDGEVVSGCAEVMERKFTGHSKLIVKDPMTRLYAGSEIQIGALQYSVSSLLDEGFIYSFAGVIRKDLSSITEQHISGLHDKGNIAFGVIFLSAILIGLGFTENLMMRASLETTSSVLIACYLIDLLIVPYYLNRRFLLASYAKGILYNDYKKAFQGLKSVKSFIISLFGESRSERVNIHSYEILDARIDQKALASILVSLCSRSPYQLHDALANYLRNRFEDLTLYNPTSIAISEVSKAISSLVATVENIEFTLGTEDFLIQRGVQVDISDIGTLNDQKQTFYYVALGREVVARFLLNLVTLSDDRSGLLALQNDQVRVCLCTDLNSEQAQNIGNEINLSATDIFSNATEPVLDDIITRLDDIALVASDETPKALLRAAKVVSGAFNEFHWDLSAYDVTTFDDQINATAWAVHTAREMEKTNIELLLVMYILIGIVLFGAALSVFTPVITLVIILISALYVRAKVWDFQRLTRP